MARPSKIDRLPDAVRARISALRAAGRTIDEILAALAGLLPEGEQPSRAGLGRHVQKIDALAARIGHADAIADRLMGVGDGETLDRIVQANARLLGSALFDLIGGEGGEAVVLEAKDAKLLSEALRNIATARKADVETRDRMRALTSLVKQTVAASDAGRLDPAEALRRIREDVYGIVA